MPGPPPKDPAQRRRRNTPQLTVLPRGRDGATPDWPLGASTDVELERWELLWGLPQAVMWERMRCELVVARYVRVALGAETEPEKLAAEARQLEDRLGLSPLAMRRNEWRVDDRDEVAERRTPAKTATRRLKAVDPDAVAGS